MTAIILNEDLLWATEAVKVVAGVVESGKEVKQIQFRGYLGEGQKNISGVYFVADSSSPDDRTSGWFSVHIDRKEVHMENGEGDFEIRDSVVGLLATRKVPAV